jgi:hypothetical protein
LLPSAGRSAWAFAGAFARLVTLAPRPAEVPALDPPPSWADWNHAGTGLWPHPEDSDVNLNEVAGPTWIDDTGRRARDRELATVEETQRFLVAYCDAHGRELSADELELSWAAGVWTRAYDARCQHAVGQPVRSLTENAARERLHRAGIG